MRTKLYILLASIILLIIVSLKSDMKTFQPTTIFKSNTQVGNLNLSGIPYSKGYDLLRQKLESPIYLHLQNKSRGVTLNEIGYSIDREKLAKLTKTCPSKILKIFCVNTSNEKINPSSIIRINKNKLENFINDLNSDIKYLSKNNVISLTNYTFRAVTPNTSVEVDEQIFTNKNKIYKMLTSNDLKINLRYKTTDDISLQKEKTQDLISTITSPLLIKYGKHPIYIPQKTLNSFITTETKDNLIYGKLLDKPINNYLDTLDKKYGSENVVIIRDSAVEFIKRAILFRATDYKVSNAVILPLEGLPKSSGKLHDKYLEVVKSQQRLYRFENGELTKKYIVSTGLTWDTPPGNYRVLGKQKMTISYFGNWYMPNYLPIGTINGYKFGFHSIPYHMDSEGTIYSRNPNTLGSPATGGCIQLEDSQALEIFNWADIGTPVYIYE